MPLSAGSKLGPYEVLAPLGAGGMGEVYRAKDTKLGRDVALKILPAVFANDPDRLARFEREARVLASLDHPNIGPIYGLEESNGTRALVLALIEGPTLADRIAQGPLPVEEAKSVALQIAEAFEYAHDRGVIHRDLKPANIKITPDGVVKVLDFGLAKALEGEDSTHASLSLPGAQSPTMLPTMSMGATQPGMILGTAAYISPEQVKGRRADRRSDIWAFGVVLYEMLTGKRPFDGESLGELFASVVRDEPKMDAIPEELSSLVFRFLAKDPRKRLQSFGEARQILEGTVTEQKRDREGVGHRRQVSGSLEFSSSSRRAWAGWIAAAVVLFLAVVLAAVSYRREPPLLNRATRSTISLPEKLFLSRGSVPVFAPDGSSIVFSAAQDGKYSLWIRSLDGTSARVLAGTENAQHPFWSPDSRFIAFDDGAKLKKIELATGSVTTLCNAVNSYLGTWGSSGRIIFGSFTTGLSSVPANGGEPVAVTTLDTKNGEISHRHPWFLPDGHHYLYSAQNRDAQKDTIYIGDLDVNDQAKRVPVIQVSSRIVYVAGYLLYGKDQALMAQPFDLKSLKLTGSAVRLLDEVDVSSTNTGLYQFTASDDGNLAFFSGVFRGNDQLSWFDRSGNVVGTLGPMGEMRFPSISPDGRTVAVDRRDPRTNLFDIWLYDVKSGLATRFTSNSRSNNHPVWSNDGSSLTFSSERDGVSSAYRKALGGPGQAEGVIPQTSPGMQPNAWASDGRFLVGMIQNPITNYDIWVLPMDPKGNPSGRVTFFAPTNAPERFPNLSPNGRWLVYASNESAGSEIYVREFPSAQGRWQVSIDGGNRPTWSKDGKEIFFISSAQGTSGKMMSVKVQDSGGKFSASAPVALFDVDLSGQTFDVSRDGRFLIPVRVEQKSALALVTNWQSLLKK